MDPLRLFLRLKRLAQNPPSKGRVKLWLVVIAVCLALFAVEKTLGWPAALTVEALRPLR